MTVLEKQEFLVAVAALIHLVVADLETFLKRFLVVAALEANVNKPVHHVVKILK
ncbi:unannotated protein [freshwater metagenome]|uniref:Unannotated protein n=1 Tax=freshwater metagenome TaxID=449393 RepID=A0A6J6LP56_9ZZZZ